MGWRVENQGRTVLFIDPGDQQRFQLSASTGDGHEAASAILAGSDAWEVHVKPGNDPLLALGCMLAIVLTSEDLYPQGH
jgi:hypothetical protein